MATTSITLAAIDKYNALTVTNFPGSTRPEIDFGSLAMVVSSTQIRVPYVRLLDEGRELKALDFERNNLVTTRFTFEIWAPLLGDVDMIVTAIRLNGGTVGAGQGFDYGTLSTLSSPKSTLEIRPEGEPRFLDPLLDITNVRIHGARLSYRVIVLESS